MGTISHFKPDQDGADAAGEDACFASKRRLAGAALAAARLVIAQTQFASSLPPSVQARWYAQVQTHLQAWRNAGGFSADQQTGSASKAGDCGAGTPVVSGCAVD